MVRIAKVGRACVAPLDDDGHALCGAHATTTRILEGFEVALCEEHAHEYDADERTERAQRN